MGRGGLPGEMGTFADECRAAAVRIRAAAVPVSLAELPEDALVDAQFVARALGISARQVRRLTWLPLVDVSPRVVRYRVSDVRAAIASRVRGAA
jgi:hypothetical protein